MAYISAKTFSIPYLNPELAGIPGIGIGFSGFYIL